MQYRTQRHQHLVDPVDVDEGHRRRGDQGRRRPRRPAPARRARRRRRRRPAGAHRQRPACASPTTCGRPSRSATTARSPGPSTWRGGRIGSTTLRVGTDLTFAAVSMPDRQAEPEFGDGWVRFTQTVGRAHRRAHATPVSRAPFVQYRAPLAWSTLELTIFADGHSEHRLTGASKFPRHWVYDTEGAPGRQDRSDRHEGVGQHRLRQAHAVGRRGLAGVRHRGRDRARTRARQPRHARSGAAEDPQGPAPATCSPVRATRATSCSCCSTECSSSMSTAPSGPRSVPARCSASGRCSKGGRRTSTLLARTPCRVAARCAAEQVDRDKLAELATNHRREVPGHAAEPTRQLVEP